MVLDAPRNRRDFSSVKGRKKTPPSARELEEVGIGYEVGPDGQILTDLRKGKEAKSSKTKKEIHRLWPEWKIRIKANFHVTIPGGHPVGSDYGHLKNILNYAGANREYALEMLNFFFDNWTAIKKAHPMAERMPVPTLAIVDVMKAEIHGYIQTNTKFGTSSKGKGKNKDGSGRGANRHQGGWEGMEKRFGSYNPKTD